MEIDYKIWSEGFEWIIWHSISTLPTSFKAFPKHPDFNAYY